MKNFLTSILLLSVITLSAQVDTKAKAILDKVSETTKTYKSITAEFTFTMQNQAANINETKKGNIIIQKEKYKLTLQGIEIFNDGKTQWTYMHDASEVNITNPDNEDPNTLNPATVFTIYEKGYKYHYLGEGSQNGAQTQKIELIPTEERDFSKVIIEINKNNNQIVSAQMIGKDGNIYLITVNKFTTDKSYPENTFTFDKSKFPGVDVVDMR
jgi:outer membrane lipoprotein-sorting protein